MNLRYYALYLPFVRVMVQSRINSLRGLYRNKMR